MGSLLHQFVHAIDYNFCPGLDKHNFKKQPTKKVKIASYSYRRNLIDFAANLVHFLKANYPEVHKLKEIQPAYVGQFIKEKEESGCSHSTLIQYRSYLRTLDKLITQTYYFKVHLARELPDFVGTPKKRDIYMRQEHIDAILELRKNSKSPALLGLRINNIFGLRTSETIKLIGKDFDLDNKVLHIVDSKGGRSRDLDLDTPEKIDIAIEVRSKFNDDEKVVPLLESGFNSFITDSLETLGIEDYKKAKTSNHAIRKKVAIGVMQDNLNKGLSEQDAKDATSKFLGHNKKRNAVVDAYIKAK